MYVISENAGLLIALESWCFALDIFIRSSESVLDSNWKQNIYGWHNMYTVILQQEIKYCAWQESIIEGVNKNISTYHSGYFS